MMDLTDFNHTHDSSPEERMRGLIEQLDAYIAPLSWRQGGILFFRWKGR